jgi:hypothetical protein
VATFVRRARREGHRCLLVIHGRGHGSGPEGAVLRDRLIEALSGLLGGDILAAATAPSAHGGGGAALVLLRKARRLPSGDAQASGLRLLAELVNGVPGRLAPIATAVGTSPRTLYGHLEENLRREADGEPTRGRPARPR